jgi:hypothetical protein
LHCTPEKWLENILDAYPFRAYPLLMETKRGPFFTQRGAAEYCGVSVRTFREWRREFAFPMSGPLGKQFAASDLDSFMSDPHSFRVVSRRKQPVPRFRVDKQGNTVVYQ